MILKSLNTKITLETNDKPYLLTDVDGVALDWVGAFGRFAEKKGFKLRMEHPLTWEMNEWFGATHQEIQQLVLELNSSHEFSKLPVFHDALQVLPLLAEKFHLVAITCCSSDPVIVQRRVENLKMLGVDFKDVHCLNFTDSKLEVLKSYPKSIWVEDRFKGAKEGLEAGHHSVLINRSYNTNDHHDEITKVDNWQDIMDLSHKVYKNVA